MSSQQPPNERPAPHAGRPRGEAWRNLQAEGIEWEGQILIGEEEEHSLSARLIITSRRLAFARGGEIVLDIERSWLKRPTYLSGSGAVNLRIETPNGHRERLPFISRDGRLAATDIVTILTEGKEALPIAPLDPVFTDVPERPAARRGGTAAPAFEPVETRPRRDDHKYAAEVIDASTLQVLDTTDFPPVTEASAPSTSRDNRPNGGHSSTEAVTISTLGNQHHRQGEWTLDPIRTATAGSSRRNRAGWAFRLSGLIALIALAAAFGSNRLPDPGELRDRGSAIIAPNETATREVAITDGVNLATRSAAETAAAIGVGGETETTETDTPAPTAAPVLMTPVPTRTASPGPTVATIATEPAATATEVVGAADPTESPVPTDTTEPTAEPTETSEPTATETLEPTATETTEPTATEAGELAPVATRTPYNPWNPTDTPVPTDTPEPTVTETLEPTATETATLVPTATNTPEPTATATLESTATPLPTETPTLIPTETATTIPTDTPTLAPTETPTLPPTETPTETATAVPTETPTLLPSETPTLLPSETPTAIVTPEATVAPTEPPIETATVAATAEPTLAPTETATLAPTAAPTDTPTVAPTGTATATASPTGTATAEPTPTPGFPVQDRTVLNNEPPEQVFATDAFRYTVEYAVRGAEIPTLDLAATAAGEWVVVVLHAQNWTDEPATLNMADFQLLVYDPSFGYQFVGLDASSPDISRFLGFDPVLGTSELSPIAGNEGIRLALVYLVPPATSDIELVDDDSGLNIGESFDLGGDVTNLGSAPVRPDLLEAEVTEVIDGRTIVVEADGFSATIQYLGVTVPTGTQCYAEEATTTNNNIVLGETVYLERQFRNRVSSDGDTLARDVWIDNNQGGLVLVSAWLASEGAAVPAPADVDVRFAGWIQAAADAAEGNIAGFWAACGGPPVSANGANTLYSTDDGAAQPLNREDRFLF